MTQATEKDIGKWCIFSDKNDLYKKMITQLEYIGNSCGKIIYTTDSGYDFEKCTPLTQEQIKVLGLEE